MKETERKFIMESGKKFDPTVKKAIAIALALVIAFSLGNILGASRNITVINKSEGGTPVTNVVAPTETTPTVATTAPTAAPTEATTILPTETTAATTAASNDATTAAPATTAASSSSSKPSSTAEIIALFKDGANKVKTDATSVVRNYEDLQHNEEYLQMPSALQSIGSGLISKFLKKNETPVTYGSKEEIIANFPVQGQTYTTQVTEADVSEATCTDDGQYYNVTLKFKESTDPAVGTGVASTFNVMKNEDITGAAPMVQKASTRYYDCKVECKIDKATGRMVSATYTMPMVLSVTAKVIVSIDAAVGMTFIHDYTINY